MDREDLEFLMLTTGMTEAEIMETRSRSSMNPAHDGERVSPEQPRPKYSDAPTAS